MTFRLSLFVRGTPVPQGSKRIGRHGNKPVILDANDSKLAPWREHMTASARVAMLQQRWTTILGPVIVHATFVVPRPQGHRGTGANSGRLRSSAPRWPAVRPDVDKYARALLDALTCAQVFKDDGQVVEIRARKVYGNPSGVDITVESVATEGEPCPAA